MGRRVVVLVAAVVAVVGLVAGVVIGRATVDDGPTGGAADDVSLQGADLVRAIAPQVDAYVESAMADWGVPAVAIGIVADDELVHGRGFGQRDDGQPVDVETMFEIGSATKAFLGVTEAIAVDDGDLDWSDHVVDHAPWFETADPKVTEQFTIADLLAQRSGLTGWALGDMMQFDYPEDDMIAAIPTSEPVGEFRSDFAYQNVFHLVAGRILADKAGVDSWDDVVHERLFDPLGMTASGTTGEVLAGSPNSVRGHQVLDGEVRGFDVGAFPTNGGGAGNIVSNVIDMSRWLRLQLNGGEVDGIRIVSEEQLAETHRARVSVTGSFEDTMRFGAADSWIDYATGWVRHSLPEGRIIEHGGATLGFQSQVSFDPDRGIGVVVLTNLSHGGSLARPVGQYVMDLVQGREPADYSTRTLEEANQATQAPERREVEGQRDLASYAGRYVSPALGAVDVRVEGDELHLELGPNAVPVVLRRVAGDEFTWHAPSPPVRPESHQADGTASFSGGTDAGAPTTMQFGVDSPPFTKEGSGAES